jgi:hypothetical protein
VFAVGSGEELGHLAVVFQFKVLLLLVYAGSEGYQPKQRERSDLFSLAMLHLVLLNPMGLAC